jgi:hypothetical protein
MPREFTDRESGRWTIDLPVGTVTRIKQADQRFNLYSTHHELDAQNQLVADANGHPKKDGVPFSAKLLLDISLFWELLWHIVEPQATERGINAEKFGQLMAADCLVGARLVFFDEWRDFFQKLQMPEQARALEILLSQHTRTLEEVTEALKSPKLREIERLAEEKMKQTVKKEFGNLQESLESILADSPGNSLT